MTPDVVTWAEFQSLTWVERLSDRHAQDARCAAQRFQSLTWVERLSDLHRLPLKST